MSVRIFYTNQSFKFQQPIVIHSGSFALGYPCGDKEQCTSYSAQFHPGEYFLECWGSEGGTGYSTLYGPGKGGKGAYTSGSISFLETTMLYLFIGQMGKNGSSYSYNGGGQGCFSSTVYSHGSGGGATDIRLSPNSDFDGLKSRIMVAGAGGGGISHEIPGLGGDAGALIGYSGNDGLIISPGPNISSAGGGTQTSGGIGGVGYSIRNNGTFGNGAHANQTDQIWGGAGGGGFYGGGAGTHSQNRVGSGGGGSSYISGYEGCSSITEASSYAFIFHNGSPNHYSNIIFASSIMKSGKELLPSPDGGISIGHSGNGAIRISIISIHTPFLESSFKLLPLIVLFYPLVFISFSSSLLF